MVSHSPKIDAATRAGVAVCRTSWTPFTKLESYVKGLTKDPNWTPEEIDEVKINIQWTLLEKTWRDRSW
jgi:hypothetical protein